MEFQETAAKSKPSQPVPEVVPTRYWKMPVLALAVTLLLLGLLGFIAVESTKHAINKSVYGRLEAVAKLKALQVVHMLDEAGEPIEKMASSPQISGALESWLGRGIRNEAKEQQVRDYLVDSIKGTDYVGLSVLSIENGTSLLSVGSEIGGGMNNHRAIPAMPNSEAVLEDIHFDKTMTGPAIRVG